MNTVWLILYESLYFTNLRNKMYQFLLFIQPIIYLLIVKYMFILRGGENEERYLFAVGIMSMWSYVLYSSGSSLVSLKWSGTLEMIINAKTSLFKIILSKAINNAFIGALTIGITLIYAKFLFRFNLSFDSLIGIIVSVLTLIVSLVSIGMLLSILYSISKNVYAHQNIILYPMMLISGIYYPIELLPEFVQYLSFLIPMSWAIHSLYFVIENNSFDYIDLITSLIVSCLYFTLSYVLLKRMTQKIKETSVMGVL
ncbi:ABC transporter permease [Robertmurraya siralis]|uniref:ABC transporter permease n=1 Tax=Robertmurraya siralis TaxID=77777 RepID=UPI00147732D8|nr:ABC transporter permease [Robertmurraya siralis]